MSVLRTPAGRDSLIAVSGYPSLGDAAALKDVLMESVDGGAGAVVDVSSLERMDVALLQVICAAARAFGDAGIRLSVADSGDPGRFKTALRAAGFADMP